MLISYIKVVATCPQKRFREERKREKKKGPNNGKTKNNKKINTKGM